MTNEDVATGDQNFLAEGLTRGIAHVRHRCEQVLIEELSGDKRRSLDVLHVPAVAFEILAEFRPRNDSTRAASLLSDLREKLDGCSADRIVLINAVLHALEHLPALRVSAKVKQLFLDEFQFFVDPPDVYRKRFRWEDVRFREMAQIATFHRYPGGQMHWSVAGIPLSWMLRTPSGCAAAVRIFGKLGGRTSFWETHLNDRRRFRIVVIERESALSYYRMAKSMELQPEIKGMTSTSWFFCKDTVRVSPNLSWVRSLPESAGAFFFEVGPAPADAGFLVGSRQRRELYENGDYRPMITCCVWPRHAMIAWANQHPEYAD